MDVQRVSGGNFTLGLRLAIMLNVSCKKNEVYFILTEIIEIDFFNFWGFICLTCFEIK
jgi:hypothetical protein